MRVTDDGSGMRPEDAKVAFLRHATSKISKAEDLDAINTYGFRGEALAAISSVSKVELITCTDSARTGFFMTLEGGKPVEEDEIGAPTGTSIIVRDLFYNTPARLNFLKKDSTEAANVITMMQHLAIGRYDVSFTLISDGKPVFQTVKSADMKKAIHAIYGSSVVDNLLPIRFSYGGFTLGGYAGRPIMTRANRNMQLAFLNGRFIKSKLIYHGIDNAYRSVRETGKQPVCFIDLKVEPSEVDVNVHPAKLEVKFLEESKLMTTLKYGLMDSLERETTIYVSTANGFRPAAEVLKIPGGVIDPSMNDVPTIAQQILFPQTRSAFLNKQQAIEVEESDAENKLPETFSADFQNEHTSDSLHSVGTDLPQQPHSVAPQTEFDAQKTTVSVPDGMRVLGEIFTVYIVVEYKDRIYLVDKHAAHEKMIYNRLVEQFEKNSDIASQRLLLPLNVSLPAEDMDSALLHRKTFNLAGFDFHESGSNQITLTAVPALIGSESCQDAFFDILKIVQDKKDIALSERQDKVFKTLACRSAMKGGKESKPEEMIPIIVNLIEQNDVNYCPHGRPIILSKTKKDIDRLFKRIK